MFKCSTCQSRRPLDCAICSGCPILKDLDFFLVIHSPDAELCHYFSSSHDLSCSMYAYVILEVLEGWRERAASLNFEDSIPLDVFQVICFSIHMGHYG